MIIDNVTTRVPLPDWVFDDEKQIKTRALQYMERYPHLRLKRIIKEKKIAICVRR